MELVLNLKFDKSDSWTTIKEILEQIESLDFAVTVKIEGITQL